MRSGKTQNKIRLARTEERIQDENKARVPDTSAKGQNKTTIANYGRSSMTSKVDPCTFFGSSINSGSDKMDAIKSMAWFDE